LEEKMSMEFPKNRPPIFASKTTKDWKTSFRVLRVLRGFWQITVAVLILFAPAACGEGKNQYVAPPPPKVTVARPDVRTVTEHLEFNGNTAAFNTVKLVARVQGYLEKIHFVDGATVKKGDLLFTIQQDQYKAQLKQAQAEVAAAKAKLENAVTEYERYLRLFQQKAAPETYVDQWKYTRDSSAAALENAQAQVDLAKLNLSYTTVTAPFDGRMGRHLIDVGNLVGGGGGGQDTVLAEINQINPYYVYFTINERDLLKVVDEQDLSSAREKTHRSKGFEVFMGLATDSGYPYRGLFDFAAITANPRTGTLQLRAVFQNPKGDIIPGLFARIQAPVRDIKDALLVPADAVGFDQLGNYVLVVKDKDIVERREVEIGEQVGEMRVIKSGLTANERVIVDGILRAVPGQQVTPEEAGKSAANRSPCYENPPTPPLQRGNVAELRTKRLPSLDGRGRGRVEASDVQHPHPTSPVEGEELDSAALTSPVGEELNSAALLQRGARGGFNDLRESTRNMKDCGGLTRSADGNGSGGAA
jgi:RND family efflux transporter MFP subunit